MSADIFVSVGRPASDSQRKLRKSVVDAIRLAGLSPRLMTDDEWDERNPLRGIKKVMDGCVGVIVVAYPRYSVSSGSELREEGEKSIDGVTFPTAWNQIEAAMAYERGLPALVVAQRGLRQDAIFETTRDFKPIWVDVELGIENSSKFTNHLRSFKEDVEEFVNRRELTAAANDPATGAEAGHVAPAPRSGLLSAVMSAITVLAATVGMLILAANYAAPYFREILLAVVSLMILALAFVSRASGLIGAEQMVKLFRFAGRKPQSNAEKSAVQQGAGDER